MESNNALGNWVRGARAVLTVSAVVWSLNTQAQEPAQREGKATYSEPRIVERGPNHKVIERTVMEVMPDGRTVQRKSSYTALATGLNYKNERGEWIENKEEIEIFQGTAVARQASIRSSSPRTSIRRGAVDLKDASGQRYRSHVLGLFHTDAASGRSARIASLQDSIGAVLPHTKAADFHTVKALEGFDWQFSGSIYAVGMD